MISGEGSDNRAAAVKEDWSLKVRLILCTLDGIRDVPTSFGRKSQFRGISNIRFVKLMGDLHCVAKIHELFVIRNLRDFLLNLKLVGTPCINKHVRQITHPT